MGKKSKYYPTTRTPQDSGVTERAHDLRVRRNEGEGFVQNRPERTERREAGWVSRLFDGKKK